MIESRSMLEENVPSNLKEVISSGNIVSLNELTEKLKLSIVQVKTEITQLVNKNLTVIEPEVEKSENFTKKINDLNSKTNELIKEISNQENLLKNVSEIDEYKNLIDHIDSVNKIIYAIKVMQKFEKQLREYKVAIDRSDFNLCNEYLKNLMEIIENEPELFRVNSKENTSMQEENGEEKEIYLVKQLREDFIVHRERLWFSLDQEWDKLISIETESTITSKLVVNTSITQEFLNELTQFSKFKLNSSHTNENAISSFVFLPKMKQFCKSFLKLCTINIINEINNNDSLNEIEIINHDINMKELTFKIRTIEEFKVDKMIDPAKLLQFKLGQIESVLKFLHDNFLNLTAILYKSNSNSKQSKIDLKLMSIFSHLILDDFVKLIYEKLIINVIPLTNYDFKIEAQICKIVGEFEEKLKALEFLKKDSTSIFKSFVTNVEELYVRKKCQHIMENARSLMKNKELILDVVSIDQQEFITSQIKRVNDSQFDKTSKSISLIDKLIKLEESNTVCNTKLDDTNFLRMPTCSISKLSKRILELIYETLNEAYLLSDRTESYKNVSLFCLVAKNLFDLYSSVIPTFYCDSLRDMPFLSAVAYNDFAYLSFNCLTLTHQYKELFMKSKTKKVKEKSKSAPATASSAFGVSFFDLDDILENFSCLDLVPKLCSIGYEILFKQIQKQQENLIQFLNEDTNGLKDISESNNFELLKKSLEKCKIQIFNIRTVWNILPEGVYFSAFSQFLNLICNDLIRSCLKLEDISSDDASYLHSAFSIVEKLVIDIFSKNKINGPNDTEDSNKIDSRFADLNAAKYVKSWQRFKYTLILLKANLQEIVDLWSDGKGPLAECFDSEEIRHLIKALFMITERRSAALAKII